MIERLLLRLRSGLRVAIFYARDWRNFLGCLADPNLHLKFGHYELFGGESLPFFFAAKDLPINQIMVGNLAVGQTIQTRRVREILEVYPATPLARDIEGRSTARVFELVDARMKGEDNFIILCERTGRKKFRKIDGATRLAVINETGGTTVNAVITLRGQSRF